MANTTNYNLNLPSKGTSNWDTLVNQNFDKIDNEMKGKIQASIYTANTNTTTNIIHNLTYNPLKDDLLAIYKGILLEKTINYTENANNISIDLVDWNINTGEKIYFKLYKDVK